MRTLAVAAALAAVMSCPVGCVLAVTSQAPARPGVRDRGEAQCVLKVTYDPNLLPLDHKMVTSLLKSPGVGEQAARDVFGESIWYHCTFPLGSRRPRTTSSGEGVLIGQLSVQIRSTDQAKPRAEEFLAALCNHLERTLSEAFKKELGRFSARRDYLTSELSLAKDKISLLRRSREALSVTAGRADLSRSSILSKISSLESKQQELEIDLAAKTERLAALRDKIAERGFIARDRAKGDAIAAELAKIVAIREKEVELIRAASNQGMATASEVRQAEAKVAEAKVKLEERREAVIKGANGELLKALNLEQVHLSIDNSELQAKLQAILKQLKPLKDPKLLKFAEEYETHFQHQLSSAERTRRDLAAMQSALGFQMRTAQPPSVTVIGGKPGAQPTTGKSGP